MFSGASLRFLALGHEVVQPVPEQDKQDDLLLCLKQTAKLLDTLPDDADEGKRLRAERTDFSYGNECSILRMHGEILNKRGVRVPAVYHSGNSDDGSSFNLLMEALPTREIIEHKQKRDVTELISSLALCEHQNTTNEHNEEEPFPTPWNQVATISKGAETSAILKWLARFHATFLPTEIGGGGVLPRPPPESEERNEVWDVGSFTVLERRPKSELENLPAMVSEFFQQFAKEDAFFAEESKNSTSDDNNIGLRLQKFAPIIAHRLRPGVNESTGEEGGAQSPFVTLCHGDLKQGNLMFRRNEKNEAEVAAIDWQWTGPGVGPADLFYVLFMGFEDEVVENYESLVVRPYYEELRKQLVAGVDKDADPYPYERILKEFKLAGLDFMRWMTAARLKDYTMDKLKKAAKEIPPDVNRGIWSRSVTRLVWAWKRTKDWLEEVEELLEA